MLGVIWVYTMDQFSRMSLLIRAEKFQTAICTWNNISSLIKLRLHTAISYPGECDLMVNPRKHRVIFSRMHFVTFVYVYNMHQDTKSARLIVAQNRYSTRSPTPVKTCPIFFYAHVQNTPSIRHFDAILTPSWQVSSALLTLIWRGFDAICVRLLFPSDEGPMLETLDYTIRIGSTLTILYFDLYLYSAYAEHYVYFLCVCPLIDHGQQPMKMR